MENLQILKEKYAQILLQHCLRLKKGEPLLIRSESKDQIGFVEILYKEAVKMGTKYVITEIFDHYDIRNYLMTVTIEQIEKSNYGNRQSWDKVISDKGNILILSTYAPNTYDGISLDKINQLNTNIINSAPLYFKGVTSYAFPWCICAVPTQIWADSLFPNEPNNLEMLWYQILKAAMIDKNAPINEWSNFIQDSNDIKNKLQALKITRMHVTNNLGTDFTVTLPNNHIWVNADKSIYNHNVGMVNFPSYEIFTTPHRLGTNGIVYASSPLVYQGKLLEDFGFRFIDGRAVEVYGDSEVKKTLEGMISHSNNAFLGEFALVDKDTPINQLNMIFRNTLIDENAKSHLAFGKAYASTIQNGSKMTKDELLAVGLNVSDDHVDFMYGTPDLNILADTNEGKKLIFKNGRFNLQ